MPDNEKVSWASFTIRVDYTPTSTPIPVDKGSLALDQTKTPTLIEGAVRVPDQETLALTGAAPTVSFDWVTSPDQGTLTLSSTYSFF
jgi:hypothetical protein